MKFSCSAGAAASEMSSDVLLSVMPGRSQICLPKPRVVAEMLMAQKIEKHNAAATIKSTHTTLDEYTDSEGI